MEMIMYIITFLAIGIVVYSADAWIARTFFKKNGKGIFTGRGVLAKVIASFILIVSMSLVFGAKSHMGLMYFFVEWLSITCGFYLGPWASKRLPRFFKKSIEYGDKLEKGEANPLKDLKNSVKLETKLKFSGPDVSDEKPVQVEEKPVEKTELPPLEKEKRELSFEERLEKFKKG